MTIDLIPKITDVGSMEAFFEFHFEDASMSTLSTIEDDDCEETERNSWDGFEEAKAFWERKHQLLQTALCRASSKELKIRNSVEDALKQWTPNCVCRVGGTTIIRGCRKCLLAEICVHLQEAGFNSAICSTKWRSSTALQSGGHTFLDVLMWNPKKCEMVRMIVEVNFRGEFEMAKESEEYRRVMGLVPEVFVGTEEKFKKVIKIMCSAVKKSMKEKNMHLGPWRKRRYVEAKWFSATCKRSTGETFML